jgi:hypothetical protein
MKVLLQRSCLSPCRKDADPKPIQTIRQRIMPLAQGKVLEIGVFPPLAIRHQAAGLVVEEIIEPRRWSPRAEGLTSLLGSQTCKTWQEWFWTFANSRVGDSRLSTWVCSAQNRWFSIGVAASLEVFRRAKSGIDSIGGNDIRVK